MAASLAFFIEISVHYVLVHCPFVCSYSRDTMSVRQSQWNVDFRLLSTDWCNQVLLTLLISLLTLSMNTSAAPSLHWANTTVLSAHQHVCTKCRVCLHYTLGFPMRLPKGFSSCGLANSYAQLRSLDTFHNNTVHFWAVHTVRLYNDLTQDRTIHQYAFQFYFQGD